MLSVTDLTVGENLALQRRRLGVTQDRMAELLGLGRDVYRSYERDADRKWRQGPPIELPLLDEGELAPEETIHILRMRLGWTLDDAAEAMGRSRATYVNIESGGRTTARWADYVINLMEKEIATAAN